MANRVFTVSELDSASPSGIDEYFEWTRANRAVPSGDWAMPLELRTSRTDPAGSASEPSEQVLGWNYEPQSFQGTWDDRHMGRGVALATLRAFEAMVKRARKVRIEFEQQTFEGLITKFEPKYKRPDKIGYSFTVSPHRRPGVIVEEPTPYIPNPDEAVDAVKSTATAMATDQAAVGGTVGSAVPTVLHPPFQPTTSLLDDVGADLTSTIDELEKAKMAVETQLEEPQAILRVAQRFQAIAAAARVTAARFLTTRTDLSLAFETAVGALEFDSWARTTAWRARLMHRQSDDLARDLAKRARPSTRKIYRPYKGESVYSVSQRFYGTPHEWRRILDTNALTTVEFTGVEKLLIPEL